jgi:glycosyltransferase involved in cell wall biosynthesis
MPFVVACPQRSAADTHAAALARRNLLRRTFIATRTPTRDVPRELVTLNPLWGGVVTAVAMAFPGYREEWFRSGIHPLFDLWVTSQLRPGDHVISSYGYGNIAFRKAKRHGGSTLIDAGNSHPEYFWDLVSEEHRIWGVNRPPYPPHWNRRARRMMDDTDFVICPSRFVEDSFRQRGFTSDRLLYVPYSADLSLFKPDPDNIPPADPLLVVCTAGPSLRKGFPYLLEAMRLIRKERDARLLLTDIVEAEMRPILAKYSDIPIDWVPALGHRDLAVRLRSAHVFVLLSIEDGFARTVTEALACGLPAVVSENTGAKDLIVEGKNGYVVPIRDAQTAAESIVKALDIRLGSNVGGGDVKLPDLSFDAFCDRFFSELNRIGMLPGIS